MLNILQCNLMDKDTFPKTSCMAGIHYKVQRRPAVVREEHPVGDFQEIVMLSINDVCWHGIIWAAWVLTTKNSRLSAGRATNFIFGNDETVAVAPLEGRACQAASAPFQLTMRQEVVNT